MPCVHIDEIGGRYSMKNPRFYIGVVLILIGALSLFTSVTDAGSEWIGSGIFLVAAAILFVAYSQTSKIGFLIPACNCLFMGLFVGYTFLRTPAGAPDALRFLFDLDGTMFFLSQALAFFTMYLLGLRRRWPLIVGTMILLFAVFIGLFAEGPLHNLDGSIIGGMFFLTAALGFGALYLLKVGSWTLYPASGLAAFAAILLVIGLSSYHNATALFLRKAFLPAALIASGLALLLRWKKNDKPTSGTPKESDSDPNTPPDSM